jgi:uncharacterized membrane protein
MPDFISTINGNVKYIYLFLVVPIIMFQVFFTPPFQTPDSPNNFDRAYQVSRGLVIGRKLNGVSGGSLNSNIISTESLFSYIPFHYNHKLTSNVLSKAELYRWRTNDKTHHEFSSFPNTSVYPPFAYLPQAFAIDIGRLLNLTILNTYRLALLFVSICAIFITYKALSLNSRITPAIFATASLPMVTCLYAAMEADALLISIGFFFAAFMAGRLDDDAPRKHDIIYASLMILFLALQKPPYIGLTLLLFSPGLVVANSYGFLKRFALAISIVTAVLVWIIYAKITAWVNIDPSHKSLASHLIYIITHPLAFSSMFVNTIASQYSTYYHQMIGVLGWLDAPFPSTYYMLAGAALIVASLLSLAPIKLTDWFILLISILSSVGMVFVALYADWSNVKSTIIQGVQGRYFLPLLPLSFMLLYPNVSSSCLIKKLNSILSFASSKSSMRAFIISPFLIAEYSFLYLLFPLITFIYSAGVIIDRYYLYREQVPSVTIKTSNADQRAIPISQGESINLLLRAPSAPYGASHLKVIDVLMATYSGTANGTITLRACINNECSKSAIDVDNQKDNSYFKFKLDRELSVNSGSKINIMITKQNGYKPAAIWLWRKRGPLVMRLSIDNKVIDNMSPRIRFIY